MDRRAPRERRPPGASPPPQTWDVQVAEAVSRGAGDDVASLTRALHVSDTTAGAGGRTAERRHTYRRSQTQRAVDSTCGEVVRLGREDDVSQRAPRLIAARRGGVFWNLMTLFWWLRSCVAMMRLNSVSSSWRPSISMRPRKNQWRLCSLEEERRGEEEERKRGDDKRQAQSGVKVTSGAGLTCWTEPACNRGHQTEQPYLGPISTSVPPPPSVRCGSSDSGSA
ncbi:hypothetical protein EYF80_051446 [Liparis tanakae]|uniref:Uncharacterized protein n=1 Tax=Liparis tanakae TaxID=230148 RepID=A0A4Z2FBY8_9TELE|nr:hypothetical protein EYF80_051446 [Liparis tanakae]